MNERMKYVIVNEDTPILFPAMVDHNFFVQGLNVTSAGFVDIEARILPEGYELIVYVYGQSTTLKKHSRTEDTEIIERMLKPRIW